VTVNGSGSTWANDRTLYVGDEGSGTVNISSGGHVTNTSAYLGYGSSATGAMTVSGAGSTWTVNGELFVGRWGNGTLNINGGGAVTISNGYLGISGRGEVTVDGVGSTWINTDGLCVGYYSFGILNVRDGLVYIDADVNVGYKSGSEGTLNLCGGTLQIDGSAILKGEGQATFNFIGGRLEGAGTIDLGAPLVQNGGRLAPRNLAGTTTIEGGYTLNAGAIEIEVNGRHTAGRDWDPVQVNGAVDLLGSNGLADGLVDVILGFAPSVADEFLILDNDGTDPIIGTFASGSAAYAMYGNSIVRFAVDYTAGDGNDIALLTEAVGVLGDYNGDGTVDAADYTVWRDTLGTTVGRHFGADGNGDGTVNEADWDVWKANFGHTASGAGSTAGQASSGTQTIENPQSETVPEPASLALMVLAGGGFAVRFRRGKR
jgi:T5SS/PEP-CTERM-associated repeat protein